MKIKKIVYFILFICLFNLGCTAADFKNITSKELVDMQKDSSVVVIDLRTPDEIKNTGIIPGAIVSNFFEPEFANSLKTWDKKKTYILYCHSGGRSAKAASKMQSLGFKVSNYAGGITGWLNEKLETIPASKK